ncbi:MAG: hypothetical protein JXQ87_16025 [Bacteroidia bacterium]
MLLLFCSMVCGLVLHAQNWEVTGNTIGSSNFLGTTNAFDLNIRTNNILRGTYTLGGKYGFGIESPRAYHELLYCNGTGNNENGLLVTLNCGPMSIFDPLQIDIIGDGIEIIEGTGTLENQNAVFNVPFNYRTGHTSNTSVPLFGGNPMFWLRQEIVVAGNNQFESKFIVMPDGSTGINIGKPRAALDVRGTNGYNRPAVIFGARALGTEQSNSNGLFEYYTQQIQYVPQLFENGYNQIVQRHDQGLFFSDGKGVDGANQSGAFVLAPWAELRNSQIGGMRMDADGNTEFHGELRATKLNVNAQWWSDFVFDDNYELPDLSTVKDSIDAIGHLPGMPSEKEVLEDGIEVSEMLALQQQKIEELTLYIILMQKQIEALKSLNTTED